MNIQNINSFSKIYKDFINFNFTKLIEIYDAGIVENSTGLLFFICSEVENKMDVSFLNEDNICQHLQKESWENLKNSTDKRIFMVNDLDKNSIFLIYV